MCGYCSERYWRLNLFPWGLISGGVYTVKDIPTSLKIKLIEYHAHVQQYTCYFRRGWWKGSLFTFLYSLFSLLPFPGTSLDLPWTFQFSCCLGLLVLLVLCYGLTALWVSQFLWVSFKLSIEPTDGSFTCIQMYFPLMRHGNHIDWIFQDR